jgi:capsular exopolysaccharide synthesis family protein
MAEKEKYHFRSGNPARPGIDWDCMAKDILQYWWMVLLAALAAALLMGAFQELRYTPQYSASTTFIIGRSGFSYQQIYDNLEQAETTTTQYAQVVNSSILKDKVCEELGLDSFAASVNVRTVNYTNLMVMTVSAQTPRLAFLISRSVRENALDLMEYFMDGVTMMELEEAVIPVHPSNSMRLGHTMRLAALTGAAVMVFLLGLISYKKDTIKSPEDISRKVDTRLLGTIYFEKRRRHLKKKNPGQKPQDASLLLDDRMLSFGFVESYRMLATRLRMALERKEKKILMVTSVSENEGKSTVSANLALALAQEGKKVLLIDCDFRSPSLYRIFREEVSEAEDITCVIRDKGKIKIGRRKSTPGLYLLLSRTPRMTPWDKESMAFLTELLHQLRGYVDYIIMDTSPMAFVSDSEEYAALADASLLVIRQDVMEASYINDAVDNLEATGTELLGCVLNGVRRGLVGRVRENSHYSGTYGNYSHYRKLEESGGEQ